MKKNKKTAQPVPPAAGHTTDKMKAWFLCNTFSLADPPPPPPFLHHSLFHSYDLEELKKELGRVEALEKQQNTTFPTEPLRKQIELIDLLNTPFDGLMFLRWRFEQAGALESELIYLLARQGNVDAAKSYSRKTYGHFWHLKRMASDGNTEALQALATLAIEATEVVNRHAVAAPHVFEPVASGQTHWPFLKSLNGKLNPIKTADEVSILRRLNSGKNTQLDLTTASRYGPDTKAIAVALKLLDYVRGMREHSMSIHRRNFPTTVQADDYLTRAGKLPEAAQSSKAVSEWWQLGKLILLASYPELDPISKADWHTIAPGLLCLTEVTNPKKIRQRILYNLERAFWTILAKPPRTARVSS